MRTALFQTCTWEKSSFFCQFARTCIFTHKQIRGKGGICASRQIGLTQIIMIDHSFKIRENVPKKGIFFITFATRRRIPTPHWWRLFPSIFPIVQDNNIRKQLVSGDSV